MSVLDEPASPIDDALGRSELARSIFSLIAKAPHTWTLRIGIYAKWGEGKTTVINLIEDLARSKGFPVARFKPSPGADAATLWGELFLAVYRALPLEDHGGRKKKLLWARAWMGKQAGAGKVLTAIAPSGALAGPVTKLIAMASDSIRQQIGIAAAGVSKLLEGLPSEQRLIVFVDDLDRTHPSVVPQLLLTLRDLDLPRVAFVLAVDPEVVTQGLQLVHPGWKDAPEFLEKIVQFHYWLDAPDDTAIKRLALQQIPLTALPIPSDVVAALISVLPRNPRRLKEFFRSLWQLAPVIHRHGPDDVDWMVLLLIELLRGEAPTMMDTLLRSKAFREKIAASTFFGKTSDTKRQDTLSKELKDFFNQNSPAPTLADGKLTRIFALIERIGDAPLITEEQIDYWARIKEQPPHMTLHEAREMLSAWSVTRTVSHLQSLFAAHTETVGVLLQRGVHGLFVQLLAVRRLCLSAAAESDVLMELKQHAAEAATALELISVLVTDFHVFSDSSYGFEPADLIALRNHCGEFVHFRNTPEYLAARGREREVLLAAASQSARLAADVLNTILHRWPAPDDQGGHGLTLHDELVDVLKPFVVADVQGRFERPEGIASLGRRLGSGVHHRLLMSPDFGLYTDTFIERMAQLADRAKHEVVIQKNFIDLIEGFAYSYTLSGGPVPDEAIERLRKAARFVPIVWRGATASPIQPRMRSSLGTVRK